MPRPTRRRYPAERCVQLVHVCVRAPVHLLLLPCQRLLCRRLLHCRRDVLCARRRCFGVGLQPGAANGQCRAIRCGEWVGNVLELVGDTRIPVRSWERVRAGASNVDVFKCGRWLLRLAVCMPSYLQGNVVSLLSMHVDGIVVVLCGLLVEVICNCSTCAVVVERELGKHLASQPGVSPSPPRLLPSLHHTVLNLPRRRLRQRHRAHQCVNVAARHRPAVLGFPAVVWRPHDCPHAERIRLFLRSVPACVAPRVLRYPFCVGC